MRLILEIETATLRSINQHLKKNLESHALETFRIGLKPEIERQLRLHIELGTVLADAIKIKAKIKAQKTLRKRSESTKGQVIYSYKTKNENPILRYGKI